MGCFEERIKTGGLICGAQGLLGEMKLLKEQSGIRQSINSELWHACAGPLVSLPQVGSLVYYFPQGHSEQVAVSTKRTATLQIPNYPNLPSQLMCQVHSVTMHADKDTDEVYAQMSLQPVNSEKDVIPIPDFGLRTSKHPSEFFCKTLTASDTSTHGGFSVPRRAAEKLFPPLDYTRQPPTQELVVRDLHDNAWTFRHIFRGQPKRHLLTTGWSMFICAKRLKAGDSVLFIRDEKSQLLVGVRLASRQQMTLPSSVLSVDSMHIGVLAAAAQATANRTPFTIFYNPRACTSEFVVQLPKYRKSLYGTQVSVGVRFGMMFETEDSGRRRFMGTVVGISDLEPLRWPGSKWRNLEVEWDEPGCSDRRSRVNAWEIETPESLFIFPSITTGLKRPSQSAIFGAENEWGNLAKRPFMRASGMGTVDHSYTSSVCSEQLLNATLLKQQSICSDQSGAMASNLPTATIENSKSEPMEATASPQVNSWLVPPQLNSSIQFPQQVEVSQLDSLFVRSGAQLPTLVSGLHDPSMIFSSNAAIPVLPNADQEMWGNQFTNLTKCPLNSFSSSSGLGDLSDCFNYGNGGSAVIDPSISNAVLDEFGALKDSEFHNLSDLQSQITSGSLADSQVFPMQDFPDSSGVTSSCNVDFDDGGLLQNGSWKQVSPPIRTYTKVQKAGSVGRSIDVATFKNYGELRCAIECMFGLEGLLNDSRSSGWKLVYVDYENDVLLVGDDPWEVFVRCVRCIRILSPSEVQQMSEEGMQLLNSAAAAAQAANGAL